jgi:CBS domain containing-hemolysin-like protein
LIWAVEKLSLPFARRSEQQVGSEEEIRILANVGNKAGTISPQESELIRKAFLLNDVTAKDMMTHRLKVSQLPAETALSELRPQQIEELHSRILVTEGGDLDKIQGVIHQRDILLALARGQTDLTVANVKTAAHFVYEATPAHRLLRDFQRTRQHLFVVVDEYGGTSGVVSLEDVLEELVGEIEDEVDARENAALDSTGDPPSETEGDSKPGKSDGLPASHSTVQEGLPET